MNVNTVNLQRKPSTTLASGQGLNVYVLRPFIYNFTSMGQMCVNVLHCVAVGKRSFSIRQFHKYIMSWSDMLPKANYCWGLVASPLLLLFYSFLLHFLMPCFAVIALSFPWIDQKKVCLMLLFIIPIRLMKGGRQLNNFCIERKTLQIIFTSSISFSCFLSLLHIWEIYTVVLSLIL